MDIFGIGDNDEELLNLIKKIMYDGEIKYIMDDQKGGWDIIFEYKGKRVYTVVSDNERGIITAYPMT